MKSVTAIGLDIAKSVFQVHGVDAAGQAVIRQRLTRGRVLAFFEKLAPCLVGMEACGSSHYWARELMARGHEVRLMPAQYVKPYVKRGKNDAADAEAICEAVTRPTMRFVPVKTPEQQSVMMLHRVRLMLNHQRTQLSNSIRAHLSEFGIVAPIGRRGIDQLLAVVADAEDARVPAEARLETASWHWLTAPRKLTILSSALNGRNRRTMTTRIAKAMPMLNDAIAHRHSVATQPSATWEFH